MKNLHLAIAVSALMLVLAFAPMILAENETADADDSSAAIALYKDTSNLPERMVISPAPAGINDADDLDTNESVSGLAIGWKRLGIWLTFNQERKAEKELELARLMLIRAKIAARNNNTPAIEAALEAHERIMDRARIRVEKIAERNISAEKLVGLNRAIEVHENRIGKMNSILENANLTEIQRERVENRMNLAESNTALLREIRANKENIQTARQEIQTRKEEIQNAKEAIANSIKAEVQERKEQRAGK